MSLFVVARCAAIFRFGFVNKAKMLIFDIDPICLFDIQISAKENFCAFCFVFAVNFVFYVIEIISQNVEKRIDVIERIVDVNNPDHHQHQNIDAICADKRKVKRNGKEHKKRKIAQKMFVGDVLFGDDLNFDRLVCGEFHIPKKPAHSGSDQKQQCDKIYGVENIERKIVVDDFHNKFDKHQNIHRHKSTYV